MRQEFFPPYPCLFQEKDLTLQKKLKINVSISRYNDIDITTHQKKEEWK